MPGWASILVVDDHSAIAAAMVVALKAEGFDSVSAADSENLSVEAVLECARTARATIVLLDLALGPGREAVPLIAPLMELGAKVLLFTASGNPTLVAAALRAGAEAVVDKSMSFGKLVATLKELAAGRELMPQDEREALIEALQGGQGEQPQHRRRFDALTQREALVLELLIAGEAPKQIARREGISVSTVRGHIERIFQKLNVRSQREALALARAAAWPDEQPVRTS